jgi:ubiquinone/menaquinone biosynthesis C-methylase UbiE
MSWLLSQIYDFALRGAERKHFAKWRREALSEVAGEVIEIGAGTGANLPHYGSSVTRLLALEPSDDMRQIARRKLDRGVIAAPPNTALAKAFGEDLPCEDASFDWAVATLVLCSVRDPAKVLSELHRVLRPGGRLAFVEHVLDPHDASNRKRQRRYQPLWGLVSASCQVVRDTERTIVDGGFEIGELAHNRMETGPRIVRPVIRGWATRV